MDEIVFFGKPFFEFGWKRKKLETVDELGVDSVSIEVSLLLAELSL